MELKYKIILIVLYVDVVQCILCPKQCDCDMDNGLNRASCVDQNIVSIDVGVPSEVQVYVLSHNGISELDNYCFKELKYTAIEVLNLSYNHIFWIGLRAFDGLEKLKHLDLSYNFLRQISMDLFWDTPQLEILDLSGNVFETLRNEPFLNQSKLQVLNLNNCRIKFLHERLFTRLPNLRKLDLSDNYMVSTTIAVFRPLRRLERLELNNEYWNCDTNFKAFETWITSRGVAYERQCKNKKKISQMSEKMVSVVVEKEDVDVNDVWNITNQEILPTKEPETPLTPFQKFDSEFSAVQAFILGLQIGAAVGIIGTYIWLRGCCNCGSLKFTKPLTRRRRRRAQRVADNEIEASLLWTTIIPPDLETPPTIRRQLSLPERCAPFRLQPYSGEPDLIRIPTRSETPPPPYNDCRISIN